ncbi:MAG: HEAT repeat domain-containing protein [Verrucomicrobia bacterium]|nr:HEAT repeat domain-containing protein [Verrucomicrobiota bacterium]
MPEPSYHDKKLSAWLADLDTLDPAKHETAGQAIRAIGTNALPILIRLLHARDSALKRALINLGEQYPFIPLQLTPAEDRYGSALQACRVLGPLAVPAIARIMPFLDGNRSVEAVKVLVAIGPETIPPLQSAFTSQSEAVRVSAIAALGTLARQSEEIVPLLIPRLGEKSDQIRITAAWALGRFGVEARTALPTLSALTNDSSYSVREQAVRAIQRIGFEPAQR